MEKIITSVQNPFVKSITKLSSKRQRRERGLFICDSYKIVKEALEYLIIDCVIVSEEMYKKYIDVILQAKEKDIDIYIVTNEISEKLSEQKTPQGIMCVAKLPENKPLLSLDKSKNYIALEAVSDPGNVGTILRCAEALGIDGIIVDNLCADPYSEKATRGAMGANLRLNIYNVFDMKEMLESVNGFTVSAAVLAAETCDVTKAFCGGGNIVIIGNEANGVKKETIESCNKLFTIKMAGKTESLNAASAASIIMWELQKCNRNI